MEKLDIANNTMKKVKVSPIIYNQVIDYILKTESNFDQQKELEEFRSIISPSLKFQVTQ